MKVEFTRDFEKQLKKLDTTQKQKVSNAIKAIMQASGTSQLTNCKKLTGHATAYRIRLGDYRLGFY